MRVQYVFGRLSFTAPTRSSLSKNENELLTETTRQRNNDRTDRTIGIGTNGPSTPYSNTVQHFCKRIVPLEAAEGSVPNDGQLTTDDASRPCGSVAVAVWPALCAALNE